MPAIRIMARAIRDSVLAIYILAASCMYALLVCKYAFGAGSKRAVQQKNLHMIRSCSLSIKRAYAKIRA